MLNSNIKYLPNRITKQLLSIEIIRKIRVLKAKSGSLTLKLIRDGEKELFLHSAYHPEREAERFIQGQEFVQVDNILLIGFGLGYHVDKIVSNLRQGQRLKIVIINPDIFKMALKTKDLEGILGDERVEIIFDLDPDQLSKKLDLFFKSLTGTNNKLIIHQQSVELIDQRFLFLKDILEEIKISRFNNTRLKQFIKYNINKNISLINDCVGINKFKDLFKNIPVFIVAAGPSLDKNIDHLKLIKERGVIIVVDTALPLLLDRQIWPDFIVSIEPIDYIYQHVFKNYPQLDIPLLHSLATSHQLLSNYQGRKVIGLSKKDLMMDKIAAVVKKGRILTGGTVAITALDFAYNLGGKPIIFVGQDFAFGDNGQTHATNTFYQKRKLDPAHLRKIPGISGKDVYTSTNYYLYLRSFEKYIATNPTEYIDATEGGAVIKGTKIKDLSLVIQDHCNYSVQKSELINKLFAKKQQVQIPNDQLKELLERGLCK